MNDTFFGNGQDDFKLQLQKYVDLFSVNTADVRNLSIAALIGQMLSQADGGLKPHLESLLKNFQLAGIADQKASTLHLSGAKAPRGK